MTKNKSFNTRNIKPFKGRMIELRYEHSKNRRKYENTLSGLITANTNEHILFRINKDEPEISLRYSQILEINEPEKWETT